MANRQEFRKGIRKKSAIKSATGVSTQEAFPSAQEAAPSTQEAAPSTQEAAPSTQEAAPSTQEVAPSTQEAAPSTQEAAPLTSHKRRSNIPSGKNTGLASKVKQDKGFSTPSELNLFNTTLSTKVRNSFLLTSIVWFIPFGAAEFAIATHGYRIISKDIGPLEIPSSLQSPLLTIVVTIAVFAVNFSFLEYQFSAYRPLIRKISIKQMLAATITLFVAILPLVSLGFSTSWAPTVALLVAPIVAYSSILLSRITHHEIRPHRLIDTATSQRRLKRFLSEFKQSVLSIPEEPMEEDKYGTTAPPSHEISWKPIPPAQRDDPFSFLSSLCAASVQGSDLHTFELSLYKTLISSHWIAATLSGDKSRNSHKYSEVIQDHMISCIRRIAIIAREGEKSDLFSTKFMNICAEFLRRIYPPKDYKSFSFSYRILGIMAEHSNHLLKRGTGVASLVPVIVARQLATRVIKSLVGSEVQSNDDMDHFQITRGLVSFADLIQNLAEAAIDSRDTNYLYRCLEALGWLGCSAIKNNFHELTTQCLNGLVQLARISRAKKLECFWTRCAITPAEHAIEKMGWILGWTINFPESRREVWARVIGEAYSRYHGKKCAITYVTTGTDPQSVGIQIKLSDIPFMISYSGNGGERMLDYSDQNMLKEYELHY